MKANYDLNTNGISKMGVLRASYYEIVEKFGDPELVCSDDNKVRVEWVLESNGRVITIYDWKETSPVEFVTTWSVGGRSTLDWVDVALLFS